MNKWACNKSQNIAISMAKMLNHPVCSLETLKKSPVCPVQVDGRELVVIYYKDQVYALDRICYRKFFLNTFLSWNRQQCIIACSISNTQLLAKFVHVKLEKLVEKAEILLLPRGVPIETNWRDRRDQIFSKNFIIFLMWIGMHIFWPGYIKIEQPLFLCHSLL